MYTSENAKRLAVVDATPPGATPGTTEKSIYECACGKGRIVYVCVPGFDDHYVKIECPDCEQRYRVDMGNGYLWGLLPC